MIESESGDKPCIISQLMAVVILESSLSATREQSLISSPIQHIYPSVASS